MEKFNLTTSGTDQIKIRKTTNLPLDNDTTALAWFKSKPVSPKNNISITDLSNFIPENSYSSNINAGNQVAKNKLVFANELGILEDSDGNTVFDSNDVSVSDVFLHAPGYDKRYQIGDINRYGFVHSFYVSRYYTLLPRNSYAFGGFDNFIPEESIPKSIKVIDEKGLEYIDPSTGIKKYRILIELLDAAIYSNRTTLPAKIIVLFQDPSPTDLSLVYDKVSLSATESISAVVPQYKENINTVSLFDRVNEESFVADNSSRRKKIYAKKSISFKNNLINNTNHKAEGFEIFVPKKALSDNRTYESFNWRLITKVKRSVDVSSVNNSEEIDSESNLKQKVVYCGVLATTAQIASMDASQNYGLVNPYIFYRLEQSPFNISKYSFENPVITTEAYNKTNAKYWIVNIDTVTDEQLSQYDLLAWTVTSAVTVSQGLKIKKYVESTQGNIVLDLSQTNTGAETIDPSLSVSTSAYPLDTWTYNTANLFLNENKSNAWPINSSIFERLTVDSQNYDVYSIFGRSNLSDLTTKKSTKEFTASISEANIILKNSRSKPIFISLEFAQQVDALSRGTILATTTQMLKYCNDLYQPSSIFDIGRSNSGSSSIVESNFTVVAAIEGPMKLLYNAVSVSLLSRAFSKKIKDIRSSMYYQISNWESSYVMNGNVLLDEEKKEVYSLIKENNSASLGTTKYARNIIPKDSSILEYYKKNIYDFLSDQHNISLQEIDTANLEFYIEVTNSDVIIANALQVINDYGVSGDVQEIPTSYSLFKLNNENINSTVYAYTDSPSAQFVVPGGFGPYVIRERLYRSSVKEINDSLSNYISSTNIYKNYSFNFSIFNSYNQSSESPVNFSANWAAVMTAEYTATLSRQARYEDVYPPGSKLLKDDVAFTAKYETGAAFSGADRIDGYRDVTSSKDPVNNFLYTGDIQQGNIIGSYGIGKPGMLVEYIKYIQISMREAGILVAGKLPELTGRYETNTSNAVKAFQASVGARFENGQVDSETKALIAINIWKSIKNNDPSRYQSILSRLQTNNPTVIKYVVAAADAIELSDLPSTEWNYRKITFSGYAGPTKLVDTIFYAVPFGAIPYNGISEQDLKNQVLKSVTIYPGTFAGAPSYKGIALKEAKVFNGVELGGPQLVKGALDYTTDAITIDVNKPMSECMFFGFKFNGGLLGGKYGSYTEGYSINKVVFEISWTVDQYNAEAIVESGYNLETTTAPVLVQYNVVGSVSNISANKAEVIDLSGVKSVKYATTPVSITYPTWSGESTLDLTKTKIDFSDTKYKPPFVPYSSGDATPSYKDESITIDLTSTRTVSINSNSFSVSNVLSSTKNPVSNSAINLTVSSNKITFETSSLIYENSNIIKSSEQLLDNYWMLKSDGSIIKNKKNTVSVIDGLVLLVQPSDQPDKIGKPYGISAQSFVNTLSDGQEINVDYGSFILINNSPDNGGFIYGFYDKKAKEFLGTNLYYVDWIRRGTENVYIGVLALDADGNIGNGTDFFGPKTNGKIIPATIPVKLACPIYNIEYVPSSRIGLSAIPPNLSKFKDWPLNITAGSFTKDIYINPAYGWTSWAKKYSGKTLRATYSTLNMDSTVWSQWLGSPYIFVTNETPIILSSKRFQLTQVPIASYAEPTVMDCGIISNFVRFQTRTSKDAEWEDVDPALIRNINCQTGIIDVIKPLNDDPDLVRVTYVAKSSGIPIRQVDGRIIPINPFLNRDSVEPEKALHIYIRPSRIEVKSSSQDGYLWNFVNEYEYGSVVDFTYDTSIFDPYNSTQYDPFALQIGLIHVLNSVDIKDLSLQDLRIKGGGVTATLGKTIDVQSYGSLDINKVFKEIPEASSFWDVYPPDQQAYPKGGFVIIKLPKEVLDNFRTEAELYSIISKNITAGVVYKIQDMEGNDWGIF